MPAPLEKSWAGSRLTVEAGCEQPRLNTLGGCYSTCSLNICIHSGVWKPFLFCSLPLLKVVIYFTENIWKNSLCLLYRILSHILRIPGFTVIPGLTVLLGTLKTGKFPNLFGAFKILLCFPFIQMEDINLDLNFQFCRTSSPLIPVSTSDLKIHLLVPESEV